VKVKVTLFNRKESITGATAIFDTVVEAQRYIKSVMDDMITDDRLRKYEIIIAYNEEVKN
jgi:hypothetical protein